MGRCYYSAGRLEDALDAANGAIAILKPLGRSDPLAIACMLRAETQRALGLLHEATESVRHVEESQEPVWVSWHSRDIANVYLASGEPSEALRALHLAGRSQADLRTLAIVDWALDDPAAFQAHCEGLAVSGDASPLHVQWRLAPARVTDPRQPRSREATLENLGPEWTWVDPYGDCSHVIDGALVIRAANCRDLSDWNVSAPRLVRAVEGDFVAQVTCSAALPDRPYIGGILAWVAPTDFLRLDVGTAGCDEVTFLGSVAGETREVGRGRLPTDRTFLRMESKDGRVRALCSADGVDWFSVGETDFATPASVQVGVHAIGAIDRLVYPGAHVDGTAIRVDDFRLWA